MVGEMLSGCFWKRNTIQVYVHSSTIIIRCMECVQFIRKCIYRYRCTILRWTPPFRNTKKAISCLNDVHLSFATSCSAVSLVWGQLGTSPWPAPAMSNSPLALMGLKSWMRFKGLLHLFSKHLLPPLMDFNKLLQTLLIL